MPDIKTKVRGTVKTLDKARVGTERLKENVISIKNKSETAYKDDSYSGNEYATNKIQNAEKQIVRKGTEEFNKQGIKSVKDTKENLKKAKNQIEAYRTRAKEKTATKKAKGMIKSKDNIRRVKGSIKTSKNGAKLTGKSIKTTEKVAKNSAKVAKETAKNTRRATQMAKKAAQATAKATKATIKIMIQIIKAIIQATSALIKLLIAGGWVSVIIILVVCLFGGILAIFNSGGDADTIKLWDGDIVAVAQTQIGVTGGDPYWSWYGFDSRVEWCACFVSWCADQVGYIEEGKTPKFSACSDGIAWYKEKQSWFDNTEYFVPFPGDIIFFDWKDKSTGNQDGVSDHVGIVKTYDPENKKIYIIEGNSNDECKERIYDKNDIQILGFGSNRIQALQEANPREVQQPKGNEYDKTMEAWKYHH